MFLFPDSSFYLLVLCLFFFRSLLFDFFVTFFCSLFFSFLFLSFSFLFFSCLCLSFAPYVLVSCSISVFVFVFVCVVSLPLLLLRGAAFFRFLMCGAAVPSLLLWGGGAFLPLLLWGGAALSHPPSPLFRWWVLPSSAFSFGIVPLSSCCHCLLVKQG